MSGPKGRGGLWGPVSFSPSPGSFPPDPSQAGAIYHQNLYKCITSSYASLSRERQGPDSKQTGLPTRPAAPGLCRQVDWTDWPACRPGRPHATASRRRRRCTWRCASENTADAAASKSKETRTLTTWSLARGMPRKSLLARALFGTYQVRLYARSSICRDVETGISNGHSVGLNRRVRRLRTTNPSQH